MKKHNWFLTVLVLLAFMFVMNTDAQAAGLTADEVKFHENWTDNYKPVKGAFAAKWYNGRQAQVMCYNQSSRSDLPAAMLQEILDYLSANRPQTSADMADQNFAYKQFETAEARTASKATQVTQPKMAAPAAPVQVKDDSAAKNLAELNALKNELADAKAAEQKRLASAKPAETTLKIEVVSAPAPARKVPVAKKAPIVSPLAACKDRVQVLEGEKATAEKSLGECQAALGKANADLKTFETDLKTAKADMATAAKTHAANLGTAKTELAKALGDGYALSTVIWFSLLFLVIGLIIGSIVRSRRP